MKSITLGLVILFSQSILFSNEPTEEQKKEMMLKMMGKIYEKIAEAKRSYNPNRMNAYLENFTNSAPGDPLVVHADVSSELEAANPEAIIYVSTDGQNSWYSGPANPLGTEGYETTWEAQVANDGGQNIAWYIEGQVDADALGYPYDRIYVTQSPKNVNSNFPPGNNLLQIFSTDPTGDASSDQDIYQSKTGYNDSNIYLQMSVSGGCCETDGGFLGPWYLYGIGIVNPESQADVAYAIGYGDGAFGQLYPGIVKLLGDLETGEITSFEYLTSDINYNISGNNLDVTTLMSYITTDPDWGPWPNSYGGVMLLPVTVSADINSNIEMLDMADPGVFLMSTQFQNGNTAPQLSAPAYDEANNSISILYSDSDNNLSVDHTVSIDGETYNMVPTDHSYYTGAAFSFSLDQIPEGPHTADFTFSDGGSSVSYEGFEFVSGGGAVSFTIGYNEGWNMVGLPVNVSDPFYLSLFPDAWEGTLYSFSTTYVQEDILTAGTGYWLRFPAEGSAVASGSELTDVTISLQEGWNMISGITSSVDETAIIDPSGILIEGTIYAFNGTYVGTNIIDPGNGYWIRSTGAGDITLSNSGAGGRISTQNEDLNAEHSLIFTNGTGYSSQLIIASSIPEDEKLKFSLPPVPPAEGFDVRFSNDMKLSENGGKVLIQNEFWPMNVKLILKEDRSEKIEWVLVDEVNGKEYSFNESDAIEISEPTERLTLYRSTLTPEHFALQQNYPNPFNPTTTIEFSVETQSIASLQIYDIKGRLVETLVSGKLVSGSHSVEWDASNVSSGVYIYKLTTPFGQQTKKLILLK